MATTNRIYNEGMKWLAEGGDLINDTIKVMLVFKTYNPKRHHSMSDVSSYELGAPPGPVPIGYTLGGQSLSGKTITQDDTNHRVVFTAGLLTWFGSWFQDQTYINTLGHAVIYDRDSQKLLMCASWQFSITPGIGFTIRWSGDGIFRWYQG